MKKLLLAVFLISCTVFGQSKSKVAVVDFEANGLKANEAKTITENLRTEISKIGTFRLIERAQSEAILQEQGFQQSGACDSESCNVEMGKLLGVDKLIVGSIGLIGETYSINSKIINVETSEIVLSENELYTGRIDGLILKSIPSLARKLSGTYIHNTPIVNPKESRGFKAPTWLKVSLGALSVGALSMWAYENQQVKTHKESAYSATTVEGQNQAIEASNKSDDKRLVYGVLAVASLGSFSVTLFF